MSATRIHPAFDHLKRAAENQRSKQDRNQPEVSSQRHTLGVVEEERPEEEPGADDHDEQHHQVDDHPERPRSPDGPHGVGDEKQPDRTEPQRQDSEP